MLGMAFPTAHLSNQARNPRVKAALCWLVILLSNLLVLALLIQLSQPSTVCLMTMGVLGPVFGLPWYVMLQKEK